MADDLHRGTYMADLLLHALESNLDQPCVYLGDEVLTARQVRDEMSRWLRSDRLRALLQGASQVHQPLPMQTGTSQTVGIAPGAAPK